MKAKSNILTGLIIFIFSFYSISINALSISITNAQFQYNSSKYLEIYIQVVGKTATFVNIDSNTMKAAVDFTILIKKNGKIINFDKYSLQSPVSDFPKDFIDIKRFKIDTGYYTMVVNAVDTNDKTNIFNFKKNINIDLNANEICISDIQLLAKVKKSDDTSNQFVKNGYYLEPALSYFLPQKVQTLGIYFEVYNLNRSMDKRSLKLLLNKGYKSNNIKTIFAKNIEANPAKLIPVLTSIDINGLPSGNYHMEVQVISSYGKIISTRYVNFQRSNPVSESIAKSKNKGYKNSFVKNIKSDSLYYSLRALLPIATGDNSISLNEVLKDRDDRKSRFFLWKFWSEKNENNPEYAYNEYMKYARAVDKTFRAQVGYGFETDRGIIYLRYGKPSQIITQKSEPNAPPYEVWFYDIIEQGHQRNVKFLFYMPSLASNDYQLLHSNCRGEKSDPAWIYKLYSKRTDANSQNNKQDQLSAYYKKLKNSFDNNAVRIWEEMK